MTDYELHSLKILLDFAFYASATDVPPTIWKYVNKIIPIFKKVILQVRKNGIRYCLNPSIDVDADFSMQTEYILKNINEYEDELRKSKDFANYIKYLKKYEEKPKYTLCEPVYQSFRRNSKKTKEKVKVHQICAAKDFSCPLQNGGFKLIKKGTLGGCIQSESNLSQKGSCWIDYLSLVIDNAKIEGDVQLENSMVFDSTIIKDKVYSIMSEFSGNSRIESSSFIVDSIINNNCYITDSSKIYNSHLWGDSEIYNSIINHCICGDYVRISHSEITNQILKGLYSIKNKKIY